MVYSISSTVIDDVGHDDSASLTQSLNVSSAFPSDLVSSSNVLYGSTSLAFMSSPSSNTWGHMVAHSPHPMHVTLSMVTLYFAMEIHHSPYLKFKYKFFDGWVLF